ncbi:MAG: 16S rRNA (guanine(966)-N(2))-methyltransferase RsmD [Deltaproteobacteria bacterium]|nr:16S rRNA (guanine(966)-N(2))-methyltransferase RsmD [Deltaproteobacteria bacterium]
MRITGGQSKGRLLLPLKGLNIRPSSDKIRETIFNIVGQDMTGMKVLDLFAGTGSLGIEALSRGALNALFIDNSIQSISLIKKNLKLIDYEQVGFVLKKDLYKGLPVEHPFLQERLNFVFMDPPYGKGLISRLLEKIVRGDILATDAIIITESSKNDKITINSKELRHHDSRIYGETKLDIFDKR